jgi:hypothetical protein
MLLSKDLRGNKTLDTHGELRTKLLIAVTGLLYCFFSGSGFTTFPPILLPPAAGGISFNRFSVKYVPNGFKPTWMIIDNGGSPGLVEVSPRGYPQCNILFWCRISPSSDSGSSVIASGDMFPSSTAMRGLNSIVTPSSVRGACANGSKSLFSVQPAMSNSARICPAVLRVSRSAPSTTFRANFILLNFFSRSAEAPCSRIRGDISSSSFSRAIRSSSADFLATSTPCAAFATSPFSASRSPSSLFVSPRAVSRSVFNLMLACSTPAVLPCASAAIAWACAIARSETCFSIPWRSLSIPAISSATALPRFTFRVSSLWKSIEKPPITREAIPTQMYALCQRFSRVLNSVRWFFKEFSLELKSFSLSDWAGVGAGIWILGVLIFGAVTDSRAIKRSKRI